MNKNTVLFIISRHKIGTNVPILQLRLKFYNHSIVLEKPMEPPDYLKNAIKLKLQGHEVKHISGLSLVMDKYPRYVEKVKKEIAKNQPFLTKKEPKKERKTTNFTKRTSDQRVIDDILIEELLSKRENDGKDLSGITCSLCTRVCALTTGKCCYCADKNKKNPTVIYLDGRGSVPTKHKNINYCHLCQTSD